MAPKKLEQLAGAHTPEDLADIQPLLNNSWFAKNAQTELEAADRAAEMAQAAAAKTEDFRTATQQFAQTMRNLRAIGKRFPEVAKFTDTAIQNLQQAMNFAGFDPQQQQLQQGQQPDFSQGQPMQTPAASQTGQSVNPSQQTPYQSQPQQPGVSVPPTPQQVQSGQPQQPLAGQPAQSAWAGGPQASSLGAQTPSGGGTPGTYVVRGSISPADKANGASVTISGPMNKSATADASGNFYFSDMVNGDYTVTPNKSGVTFMPNNQPVRVQSNSPAPLSFTAS